MGNGIGYQETDKRRLDWIEEHEVTLILAEERAVPGVQYINLYPADRGESKGNMMLLILDLDGADKFFLCSFRQWPCASEGLEHAHHARTSTVRIAI